MDLIFQILWTLIGASLSVALTKVFIQNGKAIRQSAETLSELIRQNGETLSELIRQNGEAIRQNGEAIRQNGEAMRESVEKIANLIVAEGEKISAILKKD